MPTIIDGTAGITFPNSTVQASAGQVLQVVNASYGLTNSTTSTTFVDTNLSATITPKFSTSKILVIIDQSGVGKTATVTGSGVGLALLRGSTSILNFANYAAYTNSVVANYIGSVSANYLDSPATTSATTYKTQFKQSDSTPNTVIVQNNDSISTITLMEIAG
jgi:hypothetical protein